ncbi:MAG: cystathionine gamma-synthase, partial [Ostreibacterium sp.]
CAVRAGLCSDTQHNALVPPIHLSSTFALAGYKQKGSYDYSRTNNPTRQLLNEAIAELEGGHTGITTNTGISAVLLICQLLNSEDLLVVPHDCYGGSYRLFTHLAKRGLFRLAIIDQNDPIAVDQTLAQKPKLVWIETPSNPVLRVYDIKLLCEKSHNAGVLVAVDNTFLSPILQQPLALGADIVMHSCTKFLSGHSDVISGAVVTKTAELGDTLKWWANCIGVTGSAFDSYLVMRGIRTLPARLRVHEENTHTLVEILHQHPAVSTVYYPGLVGHDCRDNHNGHQVAKAQQSGFGSILSFELTGGEQAVKALLDKLTIFTQAQSLGGVESLINHPYTMTHAAMSDEAKATAGVSLGLLRISVGIEAVEDLVEDLTQALSTLS